MFAPNISSKQKLSASRLLGSVQHQAASARLLNVICIRVCHVVACISFPFAIRRAYCRHRRRRRWKTCDVSDWRRSKQHSGQSNSRVVSLSRSLFPDALGHLSVPLPRLCFHTHAHIPSTHTQTHTRSGYGQSSGVMCNGNGQRLARRHSLTHTHISTHLPRVRQLTISLDADDVENRGRERERERQRLCYRLKASGRTLKLQRSSSSQTLCHQSSLFLCLAFLLINHHPT